MKPFDEKLADNIRELFDNYQEPVDEKAWMAMQQRLGKKAGARIIASFPYKVRAAAAVILLLVVTAVGWITFSTGKDETKMVASATGEAHVDTLHDESELPKATEPLQDTAVEPSYSELAGSIPEKRKEPIAVEYDAPEEKKSFALAEIAIIDTIYELHDYISSDILIAEVETDTIGSDFEMKLAEIHHDVIEKPEAERINNNGLTPDIRYVNGSVSAGRSSALQFLAGSMVTYTTGEIAQGLGFSAGVTGDIHLADNLSINAGGILVYNQFRFADNSTLDFAREALNSYYDSDQLLLIDMSGYEEYEFVALDLPLNLKIHITDNSRRQLYMTAGVSSFLYIQQSYTRSAEMLADIISEDRMGQTTYNRSYSNVTTSGSFDAFRRFDLARFLNLSAGYVIKRGKHNLVIEPFMKYPMYDVTSLDLKIGMAGISLKYQPGSR